MAETARFPIRWLAALSALVIGTAFLLAVAWEYWLEEPVFRLIGWAYMEPDETLDRWNVIRTSTTFAALSLVAPLVVLWRTLKAFAAHQSDLERSVGERTAALRASQAMLSTAEHIARVGSWDWDIVGGSLIWSDEQCRLFGYAPGTFTDVYEGWMVCVHPDDQKRVQQAIDAALAGQDPYDIEYPIVARDGAQRIIHAKGEVFRDGNGKPLRMVGTCHDVTERTKAAAELKLAHDLLESEIESSPDAILVVDTVGRMASFNRRFLDMWAIPPEIAQSRDDAAALAVVLEQIKEPDKFLAEVKRLYRHPDETSHDEIELSDGRILDRYSAGMYGAEKNYLGRIWFFRDITKRKHAGRALEENEARLRGILDNIADMVVTIDEKGRIESFNQAAERFFGYKEFEALGRNVSILATEPDRSKHDGYLKRYRETGKKKIIGLHGREVMATRKDGTEAPVELTVSEMRLGRRRLFVGAMRDISERKRAAEEIVRSRELLQSVIDSTPDWIFVKDLDHRFLLVNCAFAKAQELQPADMIGKPDTDFWSLELCEGDPAKRTRGFHDDDRAAFQGQLVHNPKDMATFADGVLHTLDTYKTPLRDNHGQIYGVLCYSRDVTERVRTEEALRESEARFRAIFEQAPVGVGLVGPDGRFLSVNPRLTEMLGYSSAELLQLTNTDVTHPDDIEASRVNLARLFRRECDSYSLEKRYLRTDGSILWAHLTVSAVLDEAGRPNNTIGIVEDITERKQAQEALRESEQRLAEAIRVSDIGIFDHNQREDIIYWSPQLRKIYGWGPDEPVTLQKYIDCVHPEDREQVAAAVKRAHDPKQDIAFDIEHRIVRRDGEVRWLTTRAHTFFEGEGPARRPRRTVGATLDITERKKAAAEIEFANNLLTTQIENSPDGILVVGTDRKVILFNRRFGELWKIPADIVAARVDDAILKTGTAQVKDPEKFYARVMHLYEHPEEVGREDIEFKDGRVFDRHSTSLRDSRGNYLGRVWIFHDITDRRRSEEALRQSQKLESVGQLTGGVAHNFNNLLSVVIGNLELILDQAGDDSKLVNFAQAALEGALRGAELTHHLLAFSRKQSLQPKVIDLADQLPRMGALLQGVLGEQIAVSVRPDPGLWPVAADPSQVDSAILNLALNARDAMPAGGRLVIEAKNMNLAADYAAENVEAKFGDYVLLSVSDTGDGIPPEVLEHVFEPFFTTKEVGKGSGLGLSMVYGFVKQSSGYIKIESEVGRGTTVKIYLPRATAAADTPMPAATESAAAAGNEKILVVEDNDDVRTAVVEQLAGLGYRTVAAETAAAALTLLDKHPDLDLVFSDVVMRGGMNGYDLAREIRKRRSSIKVLLTSGHNMKTAPDDGDEDFEVLRKPYRRHDLAAKLREILAAE